RRAAPPLDRLEAARGEPEQVGDGLVLAGLTQLLDRYLEWVVVRDSRGRLDHLGQRPVGDALAVGQRTADEHRRAFEPFEELSREPALPDAGIAVDREQVGATVSAGARVGVLEQLELGFSSDQRRRDCGSRWRAVEDAGRPPSPDPVAEALDVERTDVLGLHPWAREAVGVWTDQHLP